MKHRLKKTLLVLTLPFSLTCVHAVPIRSDNVTLRKLELPLNTASVDDYLLDMAKQGNINILADVTDLPAQAKVTPYPATLGAIKGLKEKGKEWEPVLFDVMGDFAAYHELSFLRPGERTFLFWHKPDAGQLLQAQMTLKQASDHALFADADVAARNMGAPADDTITGELEKNESKRVLFDYLQQAHGWTTDSIRDGQELDIRVPLSDLRPDLRALVLREFQNQWLQSSRLDLYEDTYWNGSDLRICLRGDADSEVMRLEKFEVNEDVADAEPTEITLRSVAWRLFTRRKDMEESKGVDLTQAPTAPAFQMKPADAIAVPDFDAQTMQKVYGGLGEEIINPLFDTDAAFLTKVSWEGKRVALATVIAELQKQSGVTLTLAADAPADKLVTGHCEPMTLAQLLERVSRLYGLVWSKEGDAYVAHGNDRGELHLKLLQMGDLPSYNYQSGNYVRLYKEGEKAVIVQEIIDIRGADALRAPEGVALSELPASLRDRLRRVMKQENKAPANAMLVGYNRLLAEELAQDGLIFRFGTSPDSRLVANSPDLSLFQFQMLSKDGKVATSLFHDAAFMVSRKSSKAFTNGPNGRPSRRR